MIIEDPRTGTSAQVTSDGKLKTYAVSEAPQMHINENSGESYHAIISKTPASGGNNCFFYLKNTSSDDIHVKKLRIQTASAESIQVKLNDSGTPIGGTTNTPVSQNAGSGRAASATCLDGTDITGLSGGSVVDEVFGTTTMALYEWSSSLIIPKNRTLTLYAVTTNVALKATLSFYFYQD